MNLTSEDYNAILNRIASKQKSIVKTTKAIKKLVAPKIGQIKKKRTSKSKADYKDRIATVLKETKLTWVTELKFHPKRKWRFDWAQKDFMVAIEYEGVYGGKSRHTSTTGYTKDTEKYNQAQILGWTVLRYTASNYEQLQKDLISLLSKKSLSL